MTNAYSTIRAVGDMQANAQANLPVMPDNGNPRGANNMRSTQPGMATPQGEDAPHPTPPAYFYPWLQPSSHMDDVRAMIQAPMYTGQQSYTSPPVPVVTPPMPQMSGDDGRQALPVLPSNTGIVPPQFLPQGRGFRDDTDVSQFRPVLPRAMMR
jgi:hypothetical protein